MADATQVIFVSGFNMVQISGQISAVSGSVVTVSGQFSGQPVTVSGSVINTGNTLRIGIHGSSFAVGNADWLSNPISPTQFPSIISIYAKADDVFYLNTRVSNINAIGPAITQTLFQDNSVVSAGVMTTGQVGIFRAALMSGDIMNFFGSGVVSGTAISGIRLAVYEIKA